MWLSRFGVRALSIPDFDSCGIAHCRTAYGCVRRLSAILGLAYFPINHTRVGCLKRPLSRWHTSRMSHFPKVVRYARINPRCTRFPSPLRLKNAAPQLIQPSLRVTKQERMFTPEKEFPRAHAYCKTPFPVISDSFVGSYDRICKEAPEIACLLSIQPKSREALIRWFV